ncbi:MAG: shikimate kinase [Clostridiales Family XIII bacterium]|jgi:shikimate dehydrogenase|nr:shikimate kinase [Clostridiales Family XIII bacterium]
MTEQRPNVILIGMPGSGKSSIGKSAARILGMDFVDTDDLIVEKAGKPISQIFAEKGEAAFRDTESEVIKSLAALTGGKQAVISTGGGVVLREENVAELKAIGQIFLIHRSLEDIGGGNTYDGKRPLVSDMDSLKAIWTDREKLYRAASDGVLLNEGPFNSVVSRLVRLVKE